MAVGKNTYSRSVVFQPDVEGVTAKQISSSGREVTNIKLVCGGSSAHIDIYDNANGSAKDLVWFMDVSAQGNDSDHFDYPLAFTKGIYVVMTSPSGTNAQLGFTYLPDGV